MEIKKLIKNKNQVCDKASIRLLRRYCKETWSELVKERDGRKCVMCGKKNYLNSHHIISYKCAETRFIPEVGITLCSGHHKLRRDAAHISPWVLYEWLEKNRPEQYKWFLDNRNIILNPTGIKGDKEYYKYWLTYLLERFEKCKHTKVKKRKLNKRLSA